MRTMLSGDASLVVGTSFGITDLRVRVLFAVSHPFAFEAYNVADQANTMRRIATPQSHVQPVQ